MPVPFTIWVDGDACPTPAKEVVFNAALRTQTPVRVVANSYQRLPKTALIQLIVVGKDFDAADSHIVQHVAANDIVVTADIPLAHLLVQKQAHVLSPQGLVYNAQNIGEKLATRNLMAELRGGGLIHGGPPAYGLKEKKKFAEIFDKTLTKVIQSLGASIKP